MTSLCRGLPETLQQKPALLETLRDDVRILGFRTRRFFTGSSG
jgi:hypothetical protein